MAKAVDGPPQEVEWQLDALDLRPVERWLAAIPAVGTGPEARPVSALAGPVRRLVDSYLDTADWRIGVSGHVLRVRRKGRRLEATLKDNTPATAGLRRRLEVTEPLPPAGLEALGSEGPVGSRVRALAGARPLVQVLEVRTRRRPWALRVGEETVGEVALDETVISVGDGQVPVRLRRVEVEVEPAWVEILQPLVDRLRTECGLQAATLSKFEAGLLAAGLRMPPPPELGPMAVPEDPSVGDVAYAVLRRNVAAMLTHEAGTRLGEDPEELHDMRVATRRLRAALDVFVDSLPARARLLRTELGWLAATLGSVRDLDVQLERLEVWEAQVPPEDAAALGELAGLLGAERRIARDDLLAALDSSRYERLVAGCTTMLRLGPSRRSAATRAPAVAVLPSLVHARHHDAERAARRARRSGIPADYHRLRIRGKRLRYTLEFTADVYGPTRTGPFVRRVVRLQDALGLMQDSEVATTRLRELAVANDDVLPGSTVFVMGGLAERYRAEAERLTADLPRHLELLGGSEWRKLAAAMERRRLEHSSLFPWPTPAPRPATPRRTAPQVEAVGAGQADMTDQPGPVDVPEPVIPPAPAPTPAPTPIDSDPGTGPDLAASESPDPPVDRPGAEVRGRPASSESA